MSLPTEYTEYTENRPSSVYSVCSVGHRIDWFEFPLVHVRSQPTSVLTGRIAWGEKQTSKARYGRRRRNLRASALPALGSLGVLL